MHVDHLDIDTLVSLQFGGLSNHQARAIERHLVRCYACSLAFERLKASVEDGKPDQTAAADTGTLLTKIRTWDSNRVRDGRHGEALKSRIAAELAPYVGKSGADALLCRVQDDGHDLLSAVSPLLVMFLGQRATNIIVSRLVEKTIVGIGPLCES